MGFWFYSFFFKKLALMNMWYFILYGCTWYFFIVFFSFSFIQISGTPSLPDRGVVTVVRAGWCFTGYLMLNGIVLVDWYRLVLYVLTLVVRFGWCCACWLLICVLTCVVHVSLCYVVLVCVLCVGWLVLCILRSDTSCTYCHVFPCICW